MDPGKNGAAPRYDGGGPALGHLSHRIRVGRIRNDLFPEVEVFGPRLDGRPEAEITLHEGDKGRECGEGVGWELMRLKAESVEKAAEEIAGG